MTSGRTSEVVGATTAVDRGRSVDFRGDDGQIKRLRIRPSTEFYAADGTLTHGDTPGLRTGSELFAVVFTDTSRTGPPAITATKIYEFQQPTSADPIDDAEASVESLATMVLTLANGAPPERQSPLPGELLVEQSLPAETETVLRKGNATFFCCGAAGTWCGQSCSSTQGACWNYGYKCRGDRLQMAWPRLSNTGCDASCSGGCCLPSNFPWLSCGKRVLVSNECANKGTRLTVVDCGPNPRCQTFGCNVSRAFGSTSRPALSPRLAASCPMA